MCHKYNNDNHGECEANNYWYAISVCRLNKSVNRLCNLSNDNTMGKFQHLLGDSFGDRLGNGSICWYTNDNVHQYKWMYTDINNDN